MKTTEFIQDIQNETWNKIRNSKSDAEARRILLETVLSQQDEAQLKMVRQGR